VHRTACRRDRYVSITPVPHYFCKTPVSYKHVGTDGRTDGQTSNNVWSTIMVVSLSGELAHNRVVRGISCIKAAFHDIESDILRNHACRCRCRGKRPLSHEQRVAIALKVSRKFHRHWPDNSAAPHDDDDDDDTSWRHLASNPVITPSTDHATPRHDILYTPRQ